MQGLGFSLKAGIVVIDLDNALDENQKPLEWVMPILELMPETFIEVSQSGKGLHLFLKASIGEKRKRWNLPSGHSIEVYEADRFIAFTANRYKESSLILANGQEALDTLYRDFLPKSSVEKTALFDTKEKEPCFTVDGNASLLEKMFNSENGSEIQALWYGNTAKYGSDDSRADMALLSHLSWWTNGHASQMENLFNQSALGQRAKWQERKDYRERTISCVLASFSGGYRGSESSFQEQGLKSPQNKENLPLEWEEILPLREKVEAVEPFSLECLPNTLRLWILDCSNRLQCPIDYIAVGSMVVLATVLGRKIGIMPKRKDDWLVIPNLWGMIVGSPSVMKTPALREPMRALELIETEGAMQYKQALQEWEAKLMIQEEKKKQLKEQVKKSIKNNQDPFEATVASLQEMEEAMPHRKRLIVNDSTVEKLGELLSENKNGVMVFRDELTAFFKNMEKVGHETERAFYLEAWNGDKGFTYDRIGRGTIDIESACVSVLGGIQPSPLSEYVRHALSKGSGNDGLLQRFQLAVYPDISPCWKNVDEVPDQALRQEAFDSISHLYKLTPESCLATFQNGSKFPALRFSDDAQETFNTWREQLEHDIRRSDEHPALVSHFAKYRSLIPTLALISHLADRGQGAVTRNALEKALKWDTYLRSHARRIYNLGETQSYDSAESLLKRIQKKQVKTPFSLRDVYQKGWTGLKTLEDVKQAVDILESHNILQREQIITTGRPKECIHIHPDVLAE
ncbi:MAG: DUF3987 domain-containing protein [Vampirovibrionales bacterium]